MNSETNDILMKILAYTKMNNNELKAIHSELQALRNDIHTPDGTSAEQRMREREAEDIAESFLNGLEKYYGKVDCD